MGILKDFKKSKLTGQPPGFVPQTYQESVLDEKIKVKFHQRLASSADEYIGYLKIQGSSYGVPAPQPAPPTPPVVTDYLVAENGNFLLTENDNFLIT